MRTAYIPSVLTDCSKRGGTVDNRGTKFGCGTTALLWIVIVLLVMFILILEQR